MRPLVESRLGLDLERSFSALQSRDSHSAKPLVWAVETLLKKATVWPCQVTSSTHPR